MNPRFLVTTSILFAAGPAFAVEKTNWPQWRGPDNNGSTPAASLPGRWDASDIVWKMPLPGKGCSTPIVWNDRIYITAPIDGRDSLLAIDRDGKKVWQTTIGDGEVAGRHRHGSGSNPSPITDGDAIFVNFKSGHFAALGLDGKIRWQTNLIERFGPVNLFWDHGTSPVLTEENVVIARMHQGESWLAAFDKKTGEMRWKTDRNYEVPREVDNGYTTPIVTQHQGREALLTWGAQHLTMHDAANGKLIWWCGDFNPQSTAFWPAVASPVIAEGMAVVCFGRADKGQPRLHGVKLGGSGDVTATHRIWNREDTGAFVPTPAVYKDRIYLLTDRGQVECLDPRTGRTIWSEAFPRASSNFYASPLVANGVMYAAREDGTVYVAQVERGFKLIAENKLDDKIIASIVPAGDRLLIRGHTNLYCIGQK